VVSFIQVAHQNAVSTSVFSHACHMPHPSHTHHDIPHSLQFRSEMVFKLKPKNSKAERVSFLLSIQNPPPCSYILSNLLSSLGVQGVSRCLRKLLLHYDKLSHGQQKLICTLSNKHTFFFNAMNSVHFCSITFRSN
jgi:hypothetical protein